MEKNILPCLVRLDSVLTGNTNHVKLNAAARCWPRTAQEWIEGIYGPNTRYLQLYLSDGGYSRVNVGLDALESEDETRDLLFLDSVSLALPKARWNDPPAVEIRREIEACLRETFLEFQEGERASLS